MRDLLRAALLLGDVCWGSVGLFRERGNFTDEEAGLLHQLAAPLAAGLRGGLVSEPLRLDESVDS